ncbi:caspase family protein [Aurantiacibacter gilvus]|uniref:Caspase family protein n=1 Tax=Aurantiacibacter gilvus TaxID=3139141 RepID=A0ABU9IED7_9SPHN
MIRLILPLITLVAATAHPARAECAPGSEPQGSGDRGVGLLIGVSDYAAADDGGWSPLDNAVRDVELVCSMLKQAGYRVTVLRDPEWAEIDERVVDFHLAADGAPSAIAYFAGHGFQYGGQQFLVPANAPVRSSTNELRTNFIDIENLRYALGAAEGFSLFMLDACRTANPHVHFDTVTNATAEGTVSNLGKVELPGGAVIFSTGEGRPAYDEAPIDSPLSPFADAVASNLAVPGLALFDFYGRLSEDVIERTRDMDPGGAQYPAIYISGTPNFYIVDAQDLASLSAEVDAEPAGPAATASPARARGAAEQAVAAPVIDLPDLDEIAVTDGRVLVRRVIGEPTIEEILAAAEAGDAMAQYILGLALQHGVGIAPNQQAAFDWFERSAAQGNVAGMTSLAYMLMLPDQTDLPRARALLTEASESGYAKAKSQLGFALLNGSLGETDTARAVDLFRQASDAGHVYATYALGRYGEGERGNAERRLRALADDGDVDADRWLCEMHYETLEFDGVAEHCERAARHEYPTAQAIWAGMLARGDDVRRNDERALHWAERAIGRLDRNQTSGAALYDYTEELIERLDR